MAGKGKFKYITDGGAEVDLDVLAGELHSVSSSLRQSASGINMEWPEDSQERHSDRKLIGSLSNDKAMIASSNVILTKERENAGNAFNQRQQQSEDAFGKRMTQFDETYQRYRNIRADLVRDLAETHKEIKSEVVDGAQVSTPGEIKQDALVAEVVKLGVTNPTLFNALVDAIEAMREE